jgi:hypothetical protein
MWRLKTQEGQGQGLVKIYFVMDHGGFKGADGRFVFSKTLDLNLSFECWILPF